MIIERDWAQAAEGVIALSGAREGGRPGAAQWRRALAESRLAEWRDVFADRFYLEVQRTSRVNDEGICTLQSRSPSAAVRRWSRRTTRFLKQEDFEAHETRVSSVKPNLTIRGGRVPL